MAATRLLVEMSMPWNGGLSLGEDLRLSGLSDSQESQLLYWKSEPKSRRVNLKGFTQETTKLENMSRGTPSRCYKKSEWGGVLF